MGTHPIFESDFDCLTAMNADDIFRKLTRGVSFNRNKFREDAENLGIVEKSVKNEEVEVNSKDGIFITKLNDNSNDDVEDGKKYIIDDFNGVVDRRLVKNLNEVLLWKKPTRIQMATINIILNGYNLVATAQTGSGKTGAFMIPLVQMCMRNNNKKVKNSPFGIVLASSRELAEQIGSVGRALAKNTGVSVSDTSQSDPTILTSAIICATPNRIISMMNEKKINLNNCRM